MRIQVICLAALWLASACAHPRAVVAVAATHTPPRAANPALGRLEAGPWRIVETTLEGETRTGGDQGFLVARGDRFLVVEADGKIDDHGKLDALDDGRLSLRSNDVLMELALRALADDQVALEGTATMKVGGRGDIRMVLTPAVPPPATYRPQSLIEAAALGDVPVIAEMLAAKQDVNQVVDGVTPLMKAAAFGHASAVAALLDAGARTDLRGPSGSTALLLAVDGDPETVDLLLAHGADVHVFDSDHNSPLKLALVYGSTPIARALIAAGADPHEGEAEGHSLLAQFPQAKEVLVSTPPAQSGLVKAAATQKK